MLASETRTARRPKKMPMCFNPRPPLLASETCIGRQCRCNRSVSIHARHCWRARHQIRALNAEDAAVSIHARHCWRARPGWRRHCSSSTCFNPRPPLLASETSRWCVFIAGYEVSVHARHCWRARPKCHLQHIDAPEFQSTPAIAGERDLSKSIRTATRLSFNPRPPLLASETCRSR